MLMSLIKEAAADHPGPATAGLQESLCRGEAHLWCGTIESGIACLKTKGDLCEEEWARVHHLAEGRVRETFFVTRKALRALLGRYSGHDPRHLRFAYGASGKPHLLQPGVRQPLHFNLSHTAGLFGITITTTGELGFDVERLDRCFDLLTLAEQILTPRERAEWARLPVAHRQRAILRYWTRKEAMLKASGDGLSVSPDVVEVGWHRAPKGWTVHSLAPSPGYIGCIAAPWPIRRLEHRWLVSERSDYD